MDAKEYLKENPEQTEDYIQWANGKIAALEATQARLIAALSNIVLNFDMGDFIITVAANGEDEPEHPANLDFARRVLAEVTK